MGGPISEGALDSEVRATARGRAFDRYLAALLAPRALRASLITLAAYAGELDVIPERVSEPMLGEIRLQWWRDELDRLRTGGVASGHPVADRLADLVRREDAPLAYLTGMADARAFDLGGTAMPDVGALEAYARKTEGAHGRIVAWLAGGQASALKAAELAGTAYGMVRTVAMSGRLHALGAPVLGAHDGATGVSNGMDAPSRANGVTLAEALARADGLMRQAREQARLGGSGPWIVAMLPGALVGAYAQAARRLGEEGLLQAAGEPGPLTRVSRLWLARVSGRI